MPAVSLHDILTIGTASAPKGTKATGHLDVGETNDGAPVHVPIAIIHGAAPGPVFWVQSGVHGTEYVGMAAIQRLVQTLNPDDLRGAVIALPMINILAYRAGTRAAPADGLDMNRVYPGRPLAEAMHLTAHTEMAVHTLFGEQSRVAMYAMDCHDGGAWMLMAPFAQYLSGASSCEAASAGMAMGTGISLIWGMERSEVTEKAPGTMMVACAQAGIPSCSIEVGGQGRIAEPQVVLAYRAIVNVLKHLRMLAGEPEPLLPPNKITCGHRVRPQVGGVLWSRVELLDRVKKGQIVQVVTDLFGREKEQLPAPADGIVIAVRTCGMVASGEYCSNIGEIA